MFEVVAEGPHRGRKVIAHLALDAGACLQLDPDPETGENTIIPDTVKTKFYTPKDLLDYEDALDRIRAACRMVMPGEDLRPDGEGGPVTVYIPTAELVERVVAQFRRARSHEVVVAPSHLAGAVVTKWSEGDGHRWAALDRPHPSFRGEYISADKGYITTIYLDHVRLDRFREILGSAPESGDVARAMIGVFGTHHP